MQKNKETPKMDASVKTGEFIPGRLYFTALKTDECRKSTSSVHYFSVDTIHCYESFYRDFGPLNLATVYHYCEKLDQKLSCPMLKDKKIVYYTGLNPKTHLNAAFLIGSYAVIKLGFDPRRAYEVLMEESKGGYIGYYDASLSASYTLSLLDCLKAVKKAMTFGFFDFENFDSFDYEYYERVENGDLNWIVPEKFIAFCGPHNRSAIDKGYPIHSPESYIPYFRRNNVSTIIRLNKKTYNSNRFIQAGFDHEDLFFIDGGIPCDRILTNFIFICENAKGAIAVHCKAGLGRTGTLIACYIMKHYKFTAQEAIGWIRICRPGSIIDHQQTWLATKQKQLWQAGEEYRRNMKMREPIKHTVGVYGIPPLNNNKKKSSDTVRRVVKKVDLMKMNEKSDDFESEETNVTQGDHLNDRKIQRAKARQSFIVNKTDSRTVPSKVVVSTATTSSASTGNAPRSTTTTPIVWYQRNDRNETQRTRKRKSHNNYGAKSEHLPKNKENVGWVDTNKGISFENRFKKCSSNRQVKDTAVKRSRRDQALEKDKAKSHSATGSRHGKNYRH